MFSRADYETLVYTDIGGVKIGNDKFSIIIPNGYGDGVTNIAVFDDKTAFNDNMMTYFTMISGETVIYLSGDGNITYTLHGDYLVYYYAGCIAFVRSLYKLKIYR